MKNPEESLKIGGRPQPGAGDAGDGDRPRKSAAGPLTAEEKAARARGGVNFENIVSLLSLSLPLTG